MSNERTASQVPTPPARRPYQAPKLSLHGTVAQLTAALPAGPGVQS
ncbi:MAG: hypothetical protein ABI847_16175 [Anaerolineales bacterium]